MTKPVLLRRLSLLASHNPLRISSDAHTHVFTCLIRHSPQSRSPSGMSRLDPAHSPPPLQGVGFGPGPAGAAAGARWRSGLGWRGGLGRRPGQWSVLATLSPPEAPVPAPQNPPCELFPRGPGLYLGGEAFLCGEEGWEPRVRDRRVHPDRKGLLSPCGLQKQDRRKIRVTGAEAGSGCPRARGQGSGRPGQEAGITIESEDVQRHPAPPPSGRPLQLGGRMGPYGPRGQLCLL